MNAVIDVPHITFIEPNGVRHKIDAPAGRTLLDIAQDANIDIEGACGGSLACATCHMIIDQAYFDRLPSIEPDEASMLELAAGLQKTSRLGCQLRMTEALDGLRVRLPAVW